MVAGVYKVESPPPPPPPPGGDKVLSWLGKKRGRGRRVKGGKA